VLEAAAWGLFAASSLMIGAVIGLKVPIRDRVLGLLLGFGAGTLISALSFELTEEAFRLGGADTVAAGLGAGALTYYAGDRLIETRGGRSAARGVGPALVLGAVLDGIPETAVVGISLLGGAGVSVPMLAAVFLSNLPESISAAAEMKDERPRRVLALWAVVTVSCAAAAAVGFGALDGASGDLIGFIEAFAGGAVLMTIADAMLPEAREKGGRAVGLLTVLGFALAYLLSTLE
jgi:ZIP family zinc transporter